MSLLVILFLVADAVKITVAYMPSGGSNHNSCKPVPINLTWRNIGPPGSRRFHIVLRFGNKELNYPTYLTHEVHIPHANGKDYFSVINLDPGKEAALKMYTCTNALYIHEGFSGNEIMRLTRGINASDNNKVINCNPNSTPPTCDFA